MAGSASVWADALPGHSPVRLAATHHLSWVMLLDPALSCLPLWLAQGGRYVRFTAEHVMDYQRARPALTAGRMAADQSSASTGSQVSSAHAARTASSRSSCTTSATHAILRCGLSAVPDRAACSAATAGGR